MTWGTFSPIHMLTLALGAAMLVGLYYMLKPLSRRTQTWVLGLLSLLGIAAIVFNLVAWNDPWQYLPLHLCSINALVLPAAVFSRNKTLCNLLLVWSLGALAALVLNNAMTETPIVSWTFFFYFFPHLAEFGIPILLFKLGHVEKDPRCIVPTVAISMAAYTVVHFVNLAVIRFAGENVNFMFSLRPENPLLALFYSIIPVRYWYMYMIIPILVVYLLAVYAPQLLRCTKKASLV